MRSTRKLLAAGSLTPALYFVTLAWAGAFYPNFSHVKQVASDLGASGAPYEGAIFFNIGLVGVGLAGVAASVGLVAGLRAQGKSALLTLATGIAVAAPYITLITSGLFPLPSPWHANVLVVLAGNFGPGLGALAVRDTAISDGVRIALVIGFATCLVVFLMAIGVGQFVTDENRGLFWRLYAAVLMPLLALLFWSVKQSLEEKMEVGL